MILPLSFLKKVEYYTEETYSYYENYQSGYRTRITLHFKSWFRRSKKIYFDWDFIRKEDGTSAFRSPSNLDELKTQLVDYFSKLEEELNGPIIK
jgi:hypothetical protein